MKNKIFDLADQLKAAKDKKKELDIHTKKQNDYIIWDFL